ncbi:MAG: phosphate ABC transporter permease subunit PstC [Gammaproteobacteria bacterium]|nr:phosphate ABC transporter permease subunit PstC [Gammaproteobacteria bacterium]
MSQLLLVAILLALSAIAYQLGRRRALALDNVNGGRTRLHSRPSHYAVLTMLWCLFPPMLVFTVWSVVDTHVITGLLVQDLPAEFQMLPMAHLELVVNDIRNLAQGNIAAHADDPTIQAATGHYQQLLQINRFAKSVVMLLAATAGLAIGWRLISPHLRARVHTERIVNLFLISCAALAILTTIGILLSVLFEAMRFFQTVPVTSFLFGLEWSPQTALRDDQIGSSGAFGAVPLFAGTFLISAIAMMVAVPIGLLSAIYLAEYASRRLRSIAKPLLEILAGIPTVVYGFFAALTLAPLVRQISEAAGIEAASESALAAGLVMGIMIIPFVSSLSDDVITAVPQAMRDGSYAMGATHSETILRVIIPAALPGIVGSILLAVSRAIGETMIVVMAAGLSANLTANPFAAVTTVTVQIVTLLVGDQEFDSPKTLAAFALGLVLFLLTLTLNVIALYVVRKYREQYD